MQRKIDRKNWHSRTCAWNTRKRPSASAPDNADAHVCLSIAYGKMTDFVDNKTKMEYSKVVKSEAEKAVELNPKNDLALLILARWNFDMATLNPILKAIAQALYGQLPPASKEQAVEYFQRAIAAAPERIIHHAAFARSIGIDGKAEGSQSRMVEGQTAQANRCRGSPICGRGGTKVEITGRSSNSNSHNDEWQFFRALKNTISWRWPAAASLRICG